MNNNLPPNPPRGALRSNKIIMLFRYLIRTEKPKSPLGVLGVGIIWQSWRAATKNPVEALRYE
jgi:hypothetical protein